MRYRISKISEKCLVLIISDKFKCMLVNRILRITSFLVFLRFIIPQIIRVIFMSFTLTVIPVKNIKSHIICFSSRSGISHSPLTETTCDISVFLKKISYCFHIRIKRLLAFRLYLFISSNFGMSRMLPCHQRCPGRSTYCRTCIELSETHSLLYESRQIRS